MKKQNQKTAGQCPSNPDPQTVQSESSPSSSESQRSKNSKGVSSGLSAVPGHQKTPSPHDSGKHEIPETASKPHKKLNKKEAKQFFTKSFLSAASSAPTSGPQTQSPNVALTGEFHQSGQDRISEYDDVPEPPDGQPCAIARGEVFEMRYSDGRTVGRPPNQRPYQFSTTLFSLMEERIVVGKVYNFTSEWEMDPRLAYTVQSYKENTRRISDFTEHVFAADVPFLMKHEPKGALNHTAVRKFRQQVMDHYSEELAWLYVNQPRHYGWRHSGLNNWLFHDMPHLVSNQASASFGASPWIYAQRESNRAHDKKMTPEYGMLLNNHPWYLRWPMKVFFWLYTSVLLQFFAFACRMAIFQAGIWLCASLAVCTAWSILGMFLNLPNVALPLLFFTTVGIPPYVCFCALWIVYDFLKDYRAVRNPLHYKGHMRLFVSWPWFSFWFEECIKCVPGGWWLIGMAEAIKYRRGEIWNTADWNWAHYHFHANSMRYIFADRLDLHRRWNLGLDNSDSDLYRAYSEFALRGTPLPTTFERTEKLVSSYMPSRPQSYGPQQENMFREGSPTAVTYTDPLGTEPLLHEEKQGFHAIFWPICALAKPAATQSNLVACVKSRILHAPTTVCAHSRHGLLNCSDQFIFELEKGVLIDEQAFVDHLRPTQRQKYDAAAEDVYHDEVHKTVDCFLKTDELLRDNGQKFVGRPVLNVSSYWFHKLGPMIWTLQNTVKRRFDEECEPVMWNWRATDKEYPVYFYFACGASDTTLNRFRERANTCYHQSVWIMDMGDDLWACVHDHNGQTWHIENDFSKFDRSQNADLLAIGEHLVDRMYPEYADDYRDMYDSDVRPRISPEYEPHIEMNCRKSKNLIRPAPWVHNMRFTGEPGTCLMNSWVNAVVSANILVRLLGMTRFYHADVPEDVHYLDYFNPDKVSRKYSEYGLSAKVKSYTLGSHTVRPYPNPAWAMSPPLTFLKGVWLPGESGKECWRRLPSFLCKFGKAMSDPLVTDKRRISNHRKYTSFLYAQWSGLGHLGAVTPDLHRMEDHLRHLVYRHGHWDDVLDSPALPDWVVATYVSDDPVPKMTWYAFLFERYKLDPMTWKRYVEMFCSVTSFPTVFTSEAIDDLLATDY